MALDSDHIVRSVYFAGVEKPFDAVGIADADLNMIFFLKSGSRIEVISLPENSPDGVITFPLFSFTLGMKKVDYCAIKLSQQEIIQMKDRCRVGCSEVAFRRLPGCLSARNKKRRDMKVIRCR